MRHEPSGIECDAEGSGELIGGSAFLPGAQKVHRLEPQVHGHLAVFEDRVDLHGERLPAGVALVDADAGAPAFKLADALGLYALRAHRPVWPHTRLDIGACRGSASIFASFIQTGPGITWQGSSATEPRTIPRRPPATATRS